MRKLDFVPNFKKDLSNIELMGIDYILDCVGDNSDSNSGLFGLRSDNYGFAYTSSSSYATYNVCNRVRIDIELYDDAGDMSEEEIMDMTDIEVSHFSITENDMLVMVCHTDDDKAYYFEIETDDYLL